MTYGIYRKSIARILKRIGVAAIAGVMALLPAVALAKSAGDIVVRIRGLAVIPDEGGTDDGGTLLVGGDTNLDIDLTPEVDFTYFFTDNIAAELILATTIHQASLVASTIGNIDLGSVRLLPPTLNLQYHFVPKADFSPYVGVGINYTIFYDESGGQGNGQGVIVNSIDYDNSFGYGFQVGMDWKIDDKWHLNIDLKKIFLDTKINVNSGAIVVKDADIDPWIFGLGVGYRF